jgi:hypothetical protein
LRVAFEAEPLVVLALAVFLVVLRAGLMLWLQAR